MPLGGYAQYSYTQQPSQTAIQPDQAYVVHQQAYRPTEAEAQAQLHQPGPPQNGGKLEQRVDRVEKGVGRFLKKLDKKM